MCGRPTRAARAEAKPFLQIKPVDLVDHTVDIVIEIGPRNTDFIIMLKQLLGGRESLHQRINRETHSLNFSTMPYWVSAIRVG